MERIKEKVNEYLNYICIVCIFLILFGVVYLVFFKEQEENVNLNDTVESISNEIDDENIIKVDIKGQIRNPGVYEIKKGSNINDLILLAGGILKTGTTKNINLSKVLSDQMVIYIFSKSELNKKNVEIKPSSNECVCPSYEITTCIDNEKSIIETKDEEVITNSTTNETTSNNSTSLISINTATKEELLKLNGIGESKALAIIEYRQNNGLFKSIDEIKNVSGIGDSAFEKIKEYITI